MRIGRNNGSRGSGDGHAAELEGKSAFFHRIRERAQSQSHRAIGEYLSRHYRTAVAQAAAEVAAKAGTSEATVIRLATQLGYAGYPELKQQYGLCARERKEAELARFERLAARHAIVYTSK
jgi:DNA-binding MurR/RpiR family transcriptional regulator